MINYAVVYNHTIKELFFPPACDIAKHIKEYGEDTLLIDNYELSKLKNNEIKFKKCVFLDKDIILATRLEVMGIRLYNRANAISICDDKRLTYEYLYGRIKMPETICFPLFYKLDEKVLDEFAEYTVYELNLPLIAKEAFGSLGQQVFLLKTMEEVKDFVKKHYNIPHLYQKYIKYSHGRDMRIYTVGGKPVAGMIRENTKDFRSNIAMGGKAIPIDISKEIISICEKVFDILKLDFAGLDLLFSEDGQPFLCEVNSSALFKGLNQTCNVDVGGVIAKQVMLCD